jgi:hypothetical protein
MHNYTFNIVRVNEKRRVITVDYKPTNDDLKTHRSNIYVNDFDLVPNNVKGSITRLIMRAAPHSEWDVESNILYKPKSLAEDFNEVDKLAGCVDEAQTATAQTPVSSTKDGDVYGFYRPDHIGTYPEDWDTVEDFANWYLENKMPIVRPLNSLIHLSDDATAMTLFRKGQFQVELYLIHPSPLVQAHEHPNVEVVKMQLSENIFEDNKAVIINAGQIAPTLRAGEAHGAGFRLTAQDKGFPLYSFEKWDDGFEPTTVAARWKGKTVGPLQEEMIRGYYPDAYVVDGYADVTRSMKDE